MSSDESWADSGAESEASDAESSAEEREEQAESSETDEETKYKRFPCKNWRWPVGGSGPPEGWKDAEGRRNMAVRWRMAENLRPAEQGDMDRYVPGRLAYLEKWVQEHAEPAAAFDARPATRAVCQRCHARLPFAASPEEEQKELVEHLARCWGPTEEPPVGEADGREHRPNIWGEVAAEVDTACMVFAVQAPGPAGGAYLLVTALPRHLATLTALDHQLRELWYQDRDPCVRRGRMSPDDKAHLSMFLARLPSTLPGPATMDRVELKKELQERELSVRGSREELEERVRAARMEGE